MCMQPKYGRSKLDLWVLMAPYRRHMPLLRCQQSKKGIKIEDNNEFIFRSKHDLIWNTNSNIQGYSHIRWRVNSRNKTTIRNIEPCHRIMSFRIDCFMCKYKQFLPFTNPDQKCRICSTKDITTSIHLEYHTYKWNINWRFLTPFRYHYRCLFQILDHLRLLLQILNMNLRQQANSYLLV